MRQILVRFFVNLTAAFFLSLLLLGSTAFSAAFVTFENDQVLNIRQGDFRFGDFLKIESQNRKISQTQYNVTFTTFPQKKALYRDILRITNNYITSKTIRLSNSKFLHAEIFFAQNDNQQEGVSVISLSPGSTVSINLLALPAQGEINEIENLSFNLEVE